ncbi:hypothetical protein INR49_022125 [Caranx melampygus]|nr:hypothetical protein INR49_022125 [Caranx melampygus]
MQKVGGLLRFTNIRPAMVSSIATVISIIFPCLHLLSCSFCCSCMRSFLALMSLSLCSCSP